jgi:integrase
VKRGLGHVYKRGVTYWVKFYASGKPYRESARSQVRADAVKLLRKRQAEMGQGRLIGQDAERVTFGDLAALLEADYQLNERKSLDRALRSTARLRRSFDHVRALDIPGRVSAYIAERQGEGVKPATIRLELAALKRMFTLAYREGRLPQRPYIPNIAVNNARKGFLEAAELRAVLGHLPTHLRPVVEYGYLTGWRVSEVTSLTWRQVDFQAGMVRLEPGTTKNNEGRTFPFRTYPALAALLQAQREHTSALERATATIIPFVFHRAGKRLGSFHKSWQKACAAAGVPGRIFHDLRRTAVRNMERSGVPRSVATRLTGHRTEAVYRRYAIVCEADLADGVRKLAGLSDAENGVENQGTVTIQAQSADRQPRTLR